MSRPLTRTSRPTSAAVAQAQALAAQQMALSGGGLGGLALGGTALGSTALGRTRPLSATLGGSAAIRSSSLSRTAASRRPGSRLTATTPSHAAAAAAAAMGDFNASGEVAALPSASPAESGASSALENEYITNLQQQVYFLELELNLLKKAGGGGGSLNPAGLRGSGAAGGEGASGGIGDAHAPDAPLDDVMVSLREKYVTMEAEYKKEVESLQADNAELRSRARMRELEIQNLKTLHATLAKESEQWKVAAQDHQGTLLDHQLANEQMILRLTQRLQKREKKLDAVSEQLVNLKAEFKVAQENYAAEREAYTQKWNEREAAMDALHERYLAEKAQNLEWAERFRQSNEAALMAQVQELQQVQLAHESAVKKAELQRDQAEKNRLTAVEGLQRAMDDNEQMRASLQAMEGEMKSMRDKEERDRKSKTFWSAEVASMQEQIAALTDKLAKIQAKYADAKSVRKTLKDELVQSRVFLDELQARLAEEQDAHNKTRASEEALNELTRELKRDLTLKTDELTQLMSRYKQRSAEADSAVKDRDALHVQLTELQSKFDVHEALNNLNLAEFMSIAHSNLKVAGAIENLMGKIKKGEKSDARREREKERERERERHDRRRDDDLYSDSSSISSRTPRTTTTLSSSLSPRSSAADSRPVTQESEMTRSSDSRPVTASSVADTSFDGI